MMQAQLAAQDAAHQQNLAAVAGHYQRQIADLANFVKSKFPNKQELPPSLFAAPPLPVPAPVSHFSEYIAFCFNLCGHLAGTNYITCPLCRLRRQVQTRLQVLALHRVFLHSTRPTRPTPRSRTRGLHHRRRATPRGRGRRCSGGLAHPTGTTTQRNGQGGLSRRHSHIHSQGGLCWSKVGVLRPLGTVPRARYL
jgi:hypothetical protein